LAERSEEHYLLPPFPKDNFCVAPDDSLETSPSPKMGDAYTVSPADYDNPEDTSRPGTPESPELIQPDGGDSYVNVRPWRNVDYLSHDWQEEDIWSSRKYITSRRAEYPNSARLENASWRAWMKGKNNLKTVSPETLNWLKDDVNRLYGPLQPGANKIYCTQTEPSSVSLSKSNSPVNINKKPILKKRSVSAIMLQRPLSSSVFLQQRAAVVQEQEEDGWRLTKPTLDRAATTDYAMFPFSSRMSHDTTSMLPMPASSGISSPGVERKHIHFNDKVEQCIAVEVKGCDDDIDIDQFSDSNSDDGVMMKLARPRKRASLIREKSKKGKNTLPSDGKTITMLPSTTLKHREDMLELPETAIIYSTGVFRNPIVLPSSSQETPHPSKVLPRFFGTEDEDMLDADADSGRYGSESFEDLDLHRRASTDSLTAEPDGMRRTPFSLLVLVFLFFAAVLFLMHLLGFMLKLFLLPLRLLAACRRALLAC
ncbi:hypothetical protein EDB81DRAFT_669777, partial [Dactylonectria macrodidyma]